MKSALKTLTRIQKFQIDEQRKILSEKKIEHERDVMADMFKEQKTYEIVDDQRTKRAAKEEEQKMQKVLDEIGTNSFLKNHKK